MKFSYLISSKNANKELKVPTWTMKKKTRKRVLPLYGIIIFLTYPEVT